MQQSFDSWVGSVWSGFAGFGSAAVASVDRRLVRLRLYRADSRPLNKLQTFLAVWVFVAFGLLLFNGAMELWEDEGGRGSLAVDLLAWAVWVVYTLAKVILLGVVIATIRLWSRSWKGL